MVLDVTASDSQGVQVFGESKTFNMVGYTQKDRQGQTTMDNWLIRSWDDNAIQPGTTTHAFEIGVPEGTGELDVRAGLTYHVGDSLTSMTKVSRRLSLSP